MTDKIKDAVEKAVRKAQEWANSGDYRIHAGIDRKAIAKEWKGKRVYINIFCYSAAGNYKGKYDCGYIDMENGEYITNQYTDINLADDAEHERCMR